MGHCMGSWKIKTSFKLYVKEQKVFVFPADNKCLEASLVAKIT